MIQESQCLLLPQKKSLFQLSLRPGADQPCQRRSAHTHPSIAHMLQSLRHSKSYHAGKHMLDWCWFQGMMNQQCPSMRVGWLPMHWHGTVEQCDFGSTKLFSGGQPSLGLSMYRSKVMI